ncbi:MAG: thiamine-monophosphate kinase, partial [Verrucomicrobia bacterium]|nr:thiamine-monophosphate kinase [Verrucomicrobiota bacterium]
RVQKAYRGLSRLASRFHLHVVGGETVRTRQLLISVTILGEVPRGISPGRSGAKPGDRLFVTGKLGGSWPRRHLTFTPRLEEGQWLAQKRMVTAMMDLSDGLGADLPRMARASGVGFQIDPGKLPLAPKSSIRSAFTRGEDYASLGGFATPSCPAPKEMAFLHPPHGNWMPSSPRQGISHGGPSIAGL